MYICLISRVRMKYRELGIVAAIAVKVNNDQINVLLGILEGH